MTTLNYLYSSKSRLQSFLLKNNIDASHKPFIQIFTGNNDALALQIVLDDIYDLLPHASIIATSTAGEIVEGGMLDNSTVLSISTFIDTEVITTLIEANSEEEIADTITATMISPHTKLILLFNNVYANDGENLLKALEGSTQGITIAGGNAGDNGEFSNQTIVAANQKISSSAVAVAVLNSDILEVYNNHLFNWQTLGEDMLITKSDKSIIYEINHQTPEKIYSQFLGDEIAQMLPSSGVEFPLIFKENGLDIARAPVALGDNGELIMAGHIKQGAKVNFGFGDVAENDKRVFKNIQEFSKLPVETIFIYSCSARKYFLQDNLNKEFKLLQDIAPTAGFITYGEFFKQKESNLMLNVTSTFIGLTENPNLKHSIEFEAPKSSRQSQTLNALTHLVQHTTGNLKEKNIGLNQFQDLIKKSTLYSKTDPKGIITDVNEKFCTISGYSKKELLGKAHSIVRHPDMKSSVYKDLWQTIKEKKNWTGLIKNKAKDGSTYYVRSNIFPILDTHGDIIEYISIRDEITDEIEKQERLEGSMHALEEKSHDKEYLLNQYEKMINLNSAFIRIDNNFSLLYANDVFCESYQCHTENIIDKNFIDLLKPEFLKTHFREIKETLLSEQTWSGLLPFQTQKGEILHMNTSINTIHDRQGTIVEYMITLTDITDLINAQKEIIETQKDVVYTMGAIGETRSQETGNHVKRVAEYSKILALNYGLTEEDAELLKTASPMHDIGKVAIPDAILNKPGKLTDDEFKIMKTHSVLGYKMLKNSKRKILKTAASVALTHHEKWDGSGYPKGLKGEDIDIFGRITALADVFDALGSDRCYKKSWEDEKIFTLLKEERGKHFDPRLVDIFFEQLPLFLEIRDTFKD